MTTPTTSWVTPQRVALIVALLLVGLSAGFFVAYESSVTVGLAQVDDVTYVTTIQAINATIRNFVFAVVFFGPVPALATAVYLNRRSRGLAISAAVALGLYITGVAITFGGNVPLNNELAQVTNLTPELAAAARANFEGTWNLLNLIRTTAFVVSFSVLVVATGMRATTSSNQAA